MSDWGPVFIAVVLFVLLTPGLLIQVPGHNRFIEFGNFQTSGVSVLVHAILYFALICIFLLAIGGTNTDGNGGLGARAYRSCTLLTLSTGAALSVPRKQPPAGVWQHEDQWQGNRGAHAYLLCFLCYSNPGRSCSHLYRL
ncbi:hypothetical protein Pfo_014488, partial [Paulownia fortunei]